MPSKPFWHRLRETRLVQTLVVYLAGAWIALQVVALFTNAFEWPTWVMRASIVTLSVGLVVTMVAVWVHGRARGTGEGEDAGEVAAPRSAIVAAGIVCLLVVGVGAYVILRDRGASFSPGEAIAESAAPGVAILPFRVNSDAIDGWREGMVDLLSISLDDLPGLRAIDSRTTLASWRERVGEQTDPDLQSALGVARSIGARWAVVGHAVANGPNVRLTAEVYDLEDSGGRSLGERQLDGAQDSMFSLVNRLTIDILDLMAEGGVADLPPIDLASVTTQSLPALKAFLAGEAAFRAADYDTAVPAYTDAVETDSTFALAHYRLGDAYGWIETLSGDHVLEHYRSAARHVDRLPERDAALLEVSLAYATSKPDATEKAAASAERYPDDPQAQFLLGEARFHLPQQSLPTPEEKRAPFEEAVRLDPSYTPALIHLLDLAFVAADTARVDSLLTVFRRYAAGTFYDETYARAYAVAFTDTLAPAAMAARLAEEPPLNTGRLMTLLAHPRFYEEQIAIGRERRRLDPDSGGDDFLPGALFARGRIDSLAAATMSGSLSPQSAGQSLAMAHFAGAELPDGLLEQLLTADGTDPRDPRNTFAALQALESGDRAYALDVARHSRALSDSLLAAADSAQARLYAGVAGVLEGRDLMLRGEDDRALETLAAAYRVVPFPGLALWAAELEEKAGRLERASRYLVQLAPLPWVGNRLGSIYERMGETDRAIEAYTWVVEGWDRADPFLQPRVVEARGAIARLEGLQRG